MLVAMQKNLTWWAVVIAGVAAGVVFLAINMALSWFFFEIVPTLLLRYMASLVLGTGVLTGPFELPVLLVALGVHFGLSLLFTLIIAVVVHRWGLMVGVVAGGVLGLAIYFINVYTLTVFFEWFFAINSMALALSHILFGMVAGGVYELFDDFDLPLVSEESVRR